MAISREESVSHTDRLALVLPMYNEEAAIGGVLEKWCATLDACTADYVIRVYDDGSKDASAERAGAFAVRRGDRRVEVRSHANRGHGPTILRGYREAAEDGFDWIFQLDADDEMPPDCFPELWRRRQDFDFLLGRRAGRRQPLARKFVSTISRLTVWLLYGKAVWDVNAPYRLLRTAVFADAFRALPDDLFAPNVVLSGIAARRRLRIFEMPVPQRDRMTGTCSLAGKWKLAKAAVRAWTGVVRCRFISFS